MLGTSVNSENEGFKNIWFRASPKSLDPLWKRPLNERIEACLNIARFAKKEYRPLYYFICENLDKIVDNADMMREVYYHLVTYAALVGRKDILEFIEKKIKELRKQWKGFYDNLTQEFIRKLEAKGIVRRIPTKPIDLVLDETGKFESLAKKSNDILLDIDKYKGVIYVEKAGVAQKLTELVRLGFIIVSGQGFPTIFFREFAQHGKLFIIHDADKSGNDIYRCIKYGSEHLKKKDEEFALKFIVDNARDLGLTTEDAKKLQLTPIPETPHHRKRGFLERYELESLTALELKLGIQNAYFAYALAKLKMLGVDLRPSLPSDKDALKSAISDIIKRELTVIIDEISETVAKEIIKKYKNIRETDFKLRKDILEESVKVAVKNIIERICVEGIKYKIYDFDTAIIIIPSNEVHTTNEYVEKLMKETGADKIIKVLSS